MLLSKGSICNYCTGMYPRQSVFFKSVFFYYGESFLLMEKLITIYKTPSNASYTWHQFASVFSTKFMLCIHYHRIYFESMQQQNIHKLLPVLYGVWYN